MMKTAIKWAATTLARTVHGLGSPPTQQVTYMGKVANASQWMPYGLDASVPKNFLALALSILGNPDNLVELPGSPGDGPVLAEGEVVLYHPLTGAKVHLLADGGINLTPANGVAVTVTGDLTVTGDTTVEGDTALGATVTSNGKDISDTHTHTAGTYLDSVSGAVTGTSGTPS